MPCLRLRSLWPVVIWLACSAGGATAQSLVTCSSTNRSFQLSLNTDVSQLSTNANVYSSAMTQFACHAWRLDANTYLADDVNCRGTDQWLLLEFYRTRTVNGQTVIDSPRLIQDQFFLAAKDTVPTVTTDALGGTYPNPPLNQGIASPSGPGNSGTFMDLTADAYMRPYHRLLIPNFTQPYSNNTYPVWWVTVANLARPTSSSSTSTTVQGYRIRATCVSSAAIPCPRPDFTKGSCADAGTCALSNAADPTSTTCTCQAGQGNYGCDTAVTPMSNGSSVVLSNMPGGSWRWFSVNVPPPMPQGVPRPVLLVELIRDGAASVGADPILFLKPTNTPDQNVPFFVDTSRYADLHSYYLLQSYHYHFRRDFSQTNYSFYIGVLNNNARFSGASGTFTLNVYWGTPQVPFICPAGCSGRGTCVDPTAQPATWYDPNALVPQDSSQGFICQCNRGYGGLMCEGSIIALTVGSSVQQFSSTNRPGEWDFYALTMASSLVSPGLILGWQTVDLSGGTGGALVNAFMTLDSNQYPRQADYSSGVPFKNGWQLQYTQLISNTLTNQIQIAGSSLPTTGELTVGIYNSEYVRQSTFGYQLQVILPGNNADWLHPYMSVVLGITAAIVLCLALTLCKRFIMLRRAQRLGLWVDSDGNARELVTLQGQRVLQIMPRAAGVPTEVVDTFPTFDYVPPPKGGKASPGVDPAAEPSQPSISGDPASRKRTERQALQAAAAEAATSAATATILAASQQQPLPDAAANGATLNKTISDTSPAAAGKATAGLPGPAQVSTAGVADAAVAAARAAAAAAHASQQRGSSNSGAVDAAAEAGSRVPGLHQPAGSLGGADGGDEKVEEVPQCTVCLCEYEAGEAMRRLPCAHEFHRSCIDKWMTQHTTCPMCREMLVPQEILDRQEAEAAATARAIENQQITVIYVQDEAGGGGRMVLAAQQPVSSPARARRGHAEPQARTAISQQLHAMMARRRGRTAHAEGGRAGSNAGPLGAGDAESAIPWPSTNQLTYAQAQRLRLAQAEAHARSAAAAQPQQGWFVATAWGSEQEPNDPFFSPLPNRTAPPRPTPSPIPPTLPPPPPHDPAAPITASRPRVPASRQPAPISEAVVARRQSHGPFSQLATFLIGSHGPPLPLTSQPAAAPSHPTSSASAGLSQPGLAQPTTAAAAPMGDGLDLPMAHPLQLPAASGSEPLASPGQPTQSSVSASTSGARGGRVGWGRPGSATSRVAPLQQRTTG